jgi:hypothetical protein
MERDVKEVIGILMRVIDGAEVSHEELDDLAFEADGELETALNLAYVKLCEFANDHDLRCDDPKMDQDMRSSCRFVWIISRKLPIRRRRRNPPSWGSLCEFFLIPELCIKAG